MSQYLFIDGAYLRSNFERQMQEFYGQVPRMDFLKVGASFKPVERVYYYDAIDYGQPDPVVEQKVQLHDYINSLPGFHVRDGRVRRSPSMKKREQKGVDVQLAVDALEHAARGNMTLASILTGDLDFEPLLESVVRMGIRTKLIYVPSTTPKELMRAADEIQKITLEHFFMWSAHSFQATNKVMQLKYNESPPDPQIFKPERVGKWNSRQVTLFRPVNQSPPRIYVPPGDEVTDQSYLMIHMDIDKLVPAFELTFGKIEWDSAAAHGIEEAEGSHRRRGLGPLE